MNVELAQELVNQLGLSLENLETQHAALFLFLKDQGVVTDEQLAPYLIQAGKSSGVRWRAARIRLDSLISAEKSKEEDTAEKEKRAKNGERTSEQQASGEQAPSQNREKEGQEEEGHAKEGQEKNTKPKAEEASGKPAAKEQEEDAKVAEQAYSSIPSSEPTSKTDKK